MEIGINITFVEIAPPAPAGWLSRAFVHLIYHHRSFVCSLCWLANGQTASASNAGPHHRTHQSNRWWSWWVLNSQNYIVFFFFYVHAAWAHPIVILQREQSRPPVCHPWKGQLRRAHELNSWGKIKKRKIQIFKQSQDLHHPQVDDRNRPNTCPTDSDGFTFWMKKKAASRRHISPCW